MRGFPKYSAMGYPTFTHYLAQTHLHEKVVDIMSIVDAESDVPLYRNPTASELTEILRDTKAQVYPSSYQDEKEFGAWIFPTCWYAFRRNGSGYATHADAKVVIRRLQPSLLGFNAPALPVYVKFVQGTMRLKISEWSSLSPLKWTVERAQTIVATCRPLQALKYPLRIEVE